jgi:protein tyrosine phosphatase (PTP) superfamily phosphohydrolase (DUF442 family)
VRRAPPLLASLLALPFVAAQEGTPPADPRNFTWQEEGVLAVGGGGLREDDVRWLAANGFRAIASFRSEHRDPIDAVRREGIEFLDLPVDHAVDINVTQLHAFVAWAHEMERQGRPIYAHCTNGWHRAAAFAVAWEMERHGLAYDDAAERVADRRPGTVMRAPSALLAYEAALTDRPGLVVLLHAPQARPEPGGEMRAQAEVLADGRPAPGARVRVWSEESRLRIEGTAGEDGRFAFAYRAPANHSMDHLYARASLAGFVDGADDVEMFYREAIPEPRPLRIEAQRTADGIHVAVLRDDRPVHARVLATAESGWSAFEATGTGRVTLHPPRPDDAIALRAESWGSVGAEARIPAAARPDPLDPPELDPAPAPLPPPPAAPPSAPATEAPAPAPAPVVPLRTAAACVAIALAAGGAFVIARGRRRRGSPRRLT